MEFIEENLTLSAMCDKRDRFSRLLSLIFFFAVNTVDIVIFKDSKNLIFIFFVGIVLAPICGYILGSKLYPNIAKKVQFKNSRLYKKLQKSGYLSEFMNTIDEEIKLENTVKYSSSFLGFGLLVTKTWFIYIDILHPVVVKTEDILKISEELSRRRYESTRLWLQLKDDTRLSISKLKCDDIESEIKNKYPDIMIGISIIDE